LILQVFDDLISSEVLRQMELDSWPCLLASGLQRILRNRGKRIGNMLLNEARQLVN
jgi:hypothetical protein